MATLDRSQKIIFVYKNVDKLFRQRETGEKPFPIPMGVQEALAQKENQNKQDGTTQEPFLRLKQNMKKLSQAQKKLRFLLEEISQAVKKKA